ncbi:MAG: hypothetical protein HKN17_03945 [Rhodothermales bacterium]|nr:hypothetical protein [Rhodothermales bacterium]
MSRTTQFLPLLNLMRYISRVSVLVSGLLLSSMGLDAHAQQSDRAVQAVSVSVRPIVALAVTPANGELLPGTGEAPSISMTWALTTNATGVELLASMDAPLPDGMQLHVSAESGLGERRPAVPISAAAATTLVSGIARGRESGRTIELRLIGDPAGGLFETTRSVTFTLLDPATGTMDSVTRLIRVSSADSASPTEGPALAVADSE